MKIKRWLVYYKQRRYGRETWMEVNTVTDKHPADFLLYLRATFEDHESLLLWAMPIDDAGAAERASAGL